MRTAPIDDRELVTLDVADGVATITLDSPHNRNAISRRLRADLRRHLDTATGDASVRSVVLGHTGSVFCSGADLREAREMDAEQASLELVQLLTCLLTFDKPVVAKLTGPARAGGIGLVAACDFAIATHKATFAFSEVRIGVVPSIISVPLGLRVPPGILRGLFLTGETFDAGRAAEIGLISGVSSDDDLDGDVAALTKALHLGSPQALAGAKRLMQPGTEELRRQFAEMREVSARFFSSPDAQEGVRAFAERRPPAWVHSSGGN